MDVAFWQKANDLFEQALEFPTKEERSTFLTQACGNDPSMQQAVEDLLKSLEEATGFFDRMEEELSGSLAETQVDPLRPGSQVGDYEIMERIAQGGMAVVYRARRHHRDFEQEVALKVLKRGLDTAELLRRFRAEKQILARLQHPDIAHLYDGGMTADGTPFFAMEFIQGKPLTDYVREQNLPIKARIQLFLRICRAVQFAHRNLIVHRDLKPSNVLITEDGTPKLLDFGIAKLLAPEEADQSLFLTQPEARMLTPEYAAPEQVSGQAITTSTDQYQLGLILYELLTEKRPFDFQGKNMAERSEIIEQIAPVPPSQQVEDARMARLLRGDLDTIILTTLRKEPERRYVSVDQFTEDLEAYLQERPVRAQPDTFRYRWQKFYQRNRPLVLGGSIAVLLLAMLSGIYTVALATQRDRARAEAAKASRTAEFMQSLFYEANTLNQQGESFTPNGLLGLGLKRLDTMQADPTLKGYLYQAIGLTFMGMGLEESAEGPLRKAMQLRPPHEVPDQASADAYLTVGSIALAQGEIAEADSLLNLALTISEQLPTRTYSSDINLYVSLAEVNLHQEQFEEAERFALQAEQLALDRQDTLSDYYANVLFAKGYLYLELGQLPQAIEAMSQMRALALRQSNGAPSPLLAGASHNLAETLFSAGRLLEAERMEEEAIYAWHQSVGPPSSFFLEILKSQASIKRQLGRKRANLEALKEVRRISIELYGEDLPPRYGSTLIDLSEAYRENGLYDSALIMGRRGIAIETRELGADHPEVGISLAALGLTLSNAGKLDSAALYLADAHRVLSQHYPADHPRRVILQYHKSAWFLANQQPDSALSLLQAILPVEDSTHSNHQLSLQVMDRMATCYRMMDDPEAAKQWLERARQLAKNYPNMRHDYLRTYILQQLLDLYEAEGEAQQATLIRQELTALQQQAPV